MEQWTEHFRELLGGQEEKKREEGEELEKEIEENEKRVEEEEEAAEERKIKEEVMKKIEKLKKGKAEGGDGIKNEAWIAGVRKTREKLAEIIWKTWKGEGYIEEWRDGIVIPVHKKGSTEEVKNYRGVTLTQTAYKIYSMIINDKIIKELEEKGGLDETQTEFRGGRGGMDNIYIIKHVVGQRLREKKGKVYMTFVDLKAAFDRLDRAIMWRAMENRGINKKLIDKVKEIYKETRCRVRVGKETSETFWVDKGVRQGCPLSPTLFNIYVADLEDTMRKGQDGGVVIGKEKIWSLGYADDVVLMAEDERGMREMINRAGRYFKRKKLEVNQEKTKIMICCKGKGKRRREEWRWGDKEMEEVDEIKYLGYTLSRTNSEGPHIKERIGKARKVMGGLWGIGERKFKGDVEWRLKLFDSVVKGILMYGAEIWGWEEKEEIEKLQERYLRWILGLERTTSGYIVREEMKRDKIRVEAGKRAVRYEEKIRMDEKRKLLRECWKERKKADERGKNDRWGEERKRYLWRCGMGAEEVARLREKEGTIEGRAVSRDREVQEQERIDKVWKSRSVPGYKDIRVLTKPRYMRGKRGRKGNEVSIVARLRCGNEERGRKFWLKEDKRVCRMCKREAETLEHLIERCRKMEGVEGNMEEILNEEGKGERWGKTLKERREEVERKEREQWEG